MNNQEQRIPPLMIGDNGRIFASANLLAALEVVRAGCEDIIVDGDASHDEDFWRELCHYAGMAIHSYGSPRPPEANVD